MLLWLAVLLVVAADARKFPLGDGFWFDIDAITYTALSASQEWMGGLSSWVGNTTYSVPLSSTWSSGSDAIGTYEMLTVEFSVWSNSYRIYADCVVFGQHFPEGLTGARVFDGPTPCADQDTCRGVNASISGFPVFEVFNDVPLNFLNFVGYDLIRTGVGRFGRQRYDGSTIGSPLILYTGMMETMIVSPLNHPMISVQIEEDGIVSCGPNGKIDSLPVGYVHETVLVLGQGVNATMMKWGDILLRNGKKTRPSLYAATTKLSYSTGNGAVYYYNPMPNQTYEQTMLTLKSYFAKGEVKMGTFELDSWWYYRNMTGGGGLLLWEPRPDVFPSLNMSFLQTPLWLHLRYLDKYNWYRSPNASYQFVTEDDNDNVAIPVDKAFFAHLFGQAKTWSVGEAPVVEQDWLAFQFGALNATQDNVFVAEQWLAALDDAATETGAFTMWDSPICSQVLESSRRHSALQGKGSAAMDYMPGNSQWRSGWMSMLYWSAGLIPWKDSFWTSSKPLHNCVYTPHCEEPNSLLQAAVAVLMGGPVTIGDAIFTTNYTLLSALFNLDDQTLLKPTVPAVYLPLTFLADFDLPLSSSSLVQSGTQVFVTHSQGGRVHYLLSANLSSSLSVFREDLNPVGSERLFAYDWLHRNVSVVNPLDLPRNRLPPYVPNNTDCNDSPCDETIEMSYFVVSPEVAFTFVLFGDVSKIVSMADAVFSNWSVSANRFAVAVAASVRGTVVSVYDTRKQEMLAVKCVSQSILTCDASTARCECN